MIRTPSPATGDQAVEQLIKYVGADVAPRVTPADVEAATKTVEYVKHVSVSGKVLRWAVITTPNGFSVTGRPSVAVSPENDKAEVGESVALENATDELWAFLGFELQTRLAAAAAKRAALPPTPAGARAYTGTKDVFARPMTRAEYNVYRGWELPADEDGNDKGYLVEYVDGGKSNHPAHAGYISWSPADVFARAYSPI